MNIPNSISSDELKGFLKTNKEIEEVASKESEMIELVETEVDKLFDTLPDPLLHKLVVLNLLSRLTSWHEIMADKHMEANHGDICLTWAADAGRLSAAHNIVRSVCFGEEDFTAHHTCDD